MGQKEQKRARAGNFKQPLILFTFSFLLGEVVQTIAHELEFLVNLFFKGNKPSHVFLYRDNPVLMNENIRCRIIEHLSLDLDYSRGFDESYKTLGWGKHGNGLRDKSQSCFWQLYSNVSDGNEVRTFNRSYLLVRGISVVCLFAVVIFLVDRNYPFAICASVLFLMFLWRARGMARTLVLKTVLLNLKNK